MSLVTVLNEWKGKRSTWGLQLPSMSDALFYLASPISSVNLHVVQCRHEMAVTALMTLMTAGIHVYSPAAHFRRVSSHAFPRAWSYWKPRSFAVLSRCTGLIVAEINGWEESIGVQAEMQEAHRLGLDVSFLHDVNDVHSLSVLP